jgi:CBS domain containing-hemolysin-like protein
VLRWVWVVAASAALSCFFALVSYSLRIWRRAPLEDAFAGPRGKAKLEVLEKNLSALRWTMSFCRSLANIVLIIALMKAFGVLGGIGWGLVAAVLVAMGIIAVFSIAIPQVWASYAGEKVLRATLGIQMAIRYIFYPVAAVMNAFDLPIRRLSGVVAGEANEAAKAEILQAASEGVAGGAVDAEEVDMIESVMEFGETRAAEIMTPRTELFAIPADMPWPMAAEQIVVAGHTRVPVYERDMDNIIGVLYAKDLLRLVGQDKDVPLREIIRKPFFVPETKPLDDLLRDFKRLKIHMAIILDEYGGTAGICTIEDLLEQIVGDISDEYDRDEPDEMKRISETVAEIDSRMYVDDLNDALGLELPEDEDYDTVAGFVFSELGYIPQVGEKLDTHGARFSVLAADERKIIRLRVERLAQHAGGDAGG